jgi:peptidoglycan/LPS O-acetylase OafA/YrhL
MAAVLVLTAALREPTAQGALRRPIIESLGRIGVVAYGVYLLKLPLLYVTRDSLYSFGLTPSPLVLFVVGTSLVGLASGLWYVLFERPLLRLMPFQNAINLNNVTQERTTE